MSAKELLASFHKKEARAFEALIEIYGDDVNTVLNAMHSMSARLAIISGVSPEDFSAGMKHHWDYLANAINDYAEHKERH